MRRLAWVLLPALAGCALLMPAEELPREVEEEPRLDVVDHRGPFDPSEVVTDEAGDENEHSAGSAAGDDAGRGPSTQSGAPETEDSVLADLGLELLLLAVLAALVTALIGLGRTATRRHPRVVLGVAVLALVLGLIAIG